MVKKLGLSAWVLGFGAAVGVSAARPASADSSTVCTYTFTEAA